MPINIFDPDVYEIKELNDNSLFVFWLLGNQCTYACSYCPSLFHDGSMKYQPLEIVQKTLRELPKAHVMFSGGEATFHPHFEQIVLEKPNHIMLSVLSNASRPIAFWERIVSKLHMVILTYHAEFAKLDRFLETAKLVYSENKNKGRVNLTMIPERWEECVRVYYTLKENNIPVSPKPLVENFGFNASNTIKSYTVNQLAWISKENNESSYKNIGFYDKKGNLLHKTDPAEMISAKQTNFNGWTCYTNTKVLYIDFNGNVADTACQQRKIIGSIYTKYYISEEPMLCKQNFCWCHADIAPKKIKNVEIN